MKKTIKKISNKVKKVAPFVKKGLVRLRPPRLKGEVHKKGIKPKKK